MYTANIQQPSLPSIKPAQHAQLHIATQQPCTLMSYPLSKHL